MSPDLLAISFLKKIGKPSEFVHDIGGVFNKKCNRNGVSGQMGQKIGFFEFIRNFSH